MNGRCHITIDGTLPRVLGISKAEITKAATIFADLSSRRINAPFREVAIILQDDDFSAEVHEAINGVKGPTDVITQRYDAMPGEREGIYGELYVNYERAMKAAPKRRGWSEAKELLLYIAHGIDHLSGADDFERDDYERMRRRELRWLHESEKHS